MCSQKRKREKGEEVRSEKKEEGRRRKGKKEKTCLVSALGK